MFKLGPFKYSSLSFPAWEGNFDFVAKQPYDIGETADVQHPNDTTTNVRMTQDSEITEYDNEIDSALADDFIEEEKEDGEGILCDWVVRAVPVTPDLRLNLLCQRELS